MVPEEPRCERSPPAEQFIRHARGPSESSVRSFPTAYATRHVSVISANQYGSQTNGVVPTRLTGSGARGSDAAVEACRARLVTSVSLSCKVTER